MSSDAHAHDAELCDLTWLRVRVVAGVLLVAAYVLVRETWREWRMGR